MIKPDYQSYQWLDYTQWKSARWKTAIHRTALSRPIKLAIEKGVIHDNCQLLDLGCGHRSDCNILHSRGINAIGFDPYYYPQFELIQPSQIVSLCFVINVIECPIERHKVVQWAWELTQKWLIIAVQPPRKTEGKIGEVHTKINTFQKYYTQQELLDFVRNITKSQHILSKAGITIISKQ